MTIFCQADLEGIPEITLNITSSSLEFLVVHPCVLEGDTHVQIPSFQPSQMLKGPELVGRKVRFRPPTESFPLCHYKSKTPHGLPVKGIYQMQVRHNGIAYILIDPEQLVRVKQENSAKIGVMKIFKIAESALFHPN